MNKYVIMYKDADKNVWVVERGFSRDQALKRLDKVKGAGLYFETAHGFVRTI